MNYPNGKNAAAIHQQAAMRQSHGNRGMTLENDINETNKFYLETDRAIIHKKPTPIQIVNVNYPKRSAAVITEAYFKQASTTDYNGIYKAKYVDFEAKETKNTTSFPFSNIHEHQMKHMAKVLQHGGICFIIIRFSKLGETYYVPAEVLLASWKSHLKGGRKSLPYKDIQQKGFLIPFHYQARVNYLNIIDHLYF
ncbi:Holliday junction resolvase RecU [Virgibacillus sp. 179-BFC.A HS]|uniref:Holliday junction resolvase RecU n=1 Tax=Tigheibacillus jepli TaxID=3035914 RepID=A0ABU5CJM8_9BACI|nr:Holliday junction resolvase RecU [Virgibacillus sp. 179-BFC.A HS]MDY0405728.1 Holliday junction resolvase RecU [Virgibacillus sp. 179-BFC.A HS]